MTTNKKLEHLFKEMAAMYAFLNGENRFRVIAYENAARIIGDLEDDVIHYSEKELEALKGIGHGTATKIEEYLRTGRITKHKELKSRVPYELIEFVEVKGLGPRTIKAIYEQLGINSRVEFIDALKDGRIANLKGFGEKKVNNIIKGIEQRKLAEERILLWDALKLGDRIVAQLKARAQIKKIELAGSIRRRKDTIGDLDILVTCEEQNRPKVIEQFTTLTGVKEVLAKGETKASVVIEDYNRQADLRVVNVEEWGSAMVYFTGSKQHNIHIRSLAKEKDLKVSEYGVFASKKDKRIAARTEEKVYKALGMQWIPPEMREDNGEIEASLAHKIPGLVKIEDIRGDLHMHSKWTDGRNSIEEIARYIKENYNYGYMAITDHSKSLRIANGLTEKECLKQMAEIRLVNEKMNGDFIKKGIEVDILDNGALDLSDEVLSQLDWVIASIHSKFNQDNTERLIRACENPLVHVIGHPSGRLIGTREAYKVEMEKVIEAAKFTHTALEINAQPNRMDLNDQHARMAHERGVKILISSDSHTFANLDYMKLGVAIARRAWCSPKDILNTRSWRDITKFFRNKRVMAGMD